MPQVSPFLRRVSAPLSTTSQSHSQSHHDLPAPLSTSQSFFCRSAEQIAPELIGFLLVMSQADGELLWDGDTPLRQSGWIRTDPNVGLLFDGLRW